MADEKYTFEQARIRLEEIAVEVRKKDTSLEKSLDLLEEGVRLANICTELVDHTDVSATVVSSDPEGMTEEPDGEEHASAGNLDGVGEASDATSPPDVDGDAGEPAEPDITPDEDADGFDDSDDELDEPTDTGADD